jgi:hypothetical protein
MQRDAIDDRAEEGGGEEGGGEGGAQPMDMDDEEEDRPEAEEGAVDDGGGGGRTGRGGARKVTVRMYAKYRMMQRGPPDTLAQHSPFLTWGKLFEEWMVDMFAKQQEQELWFQRRNQEKLRGDSLRGLRDQLAAGADNPDALGRQVILSSSFVGGPRYMHQLYHDSMAVCRSCGKPDLFVTMTCNPAWPEIAQALPAQQSTSDRRELQHRVFRLKLKQLVEDLTQRCVLGVPVAYVDVIEFQKRGLPHAHLLLWLHPAFKPKIGRDIDDLVCAELPDPRSTDPRERELFELVQKHMMHGPCGRDHPDCPCMKDGACRRRFPKPFRQETAIPDDGYVLYACTRIRHGG